MSAAIADHLLPDELPERFVGHKRMTIHLNYGRDGGSGIYRWYDRDDRAWPIQEQYDTRKVNAAKTGVVIIDPSEPNGFYGDVVPTYRELREVWKRWREQKKAEATGQQDVIADDDLDAWECSACCGQGKYEKLEKVSHHFGWDMLPFMVECETCGGLGYCGPDAEKRAAIAKTATSEGTASAQRINREVPVVQWERKKPDDSEGGLA